MQLCIENVGSISGACGYGYSCVYSTAISWASPTMPFPSERDPRVVFERLFGDGGDRIGADRSAARQDLSHRRRDPAEGCAASRRSSDPSDRLRLTEYLDDVGEIERRLQKIEKRNTRRRGPEPARRADRRARLLRRACEADVRPAGARLRRREVTRVSSFKMGRDVSARVFPESGVSTPFHALSHHGDNSATIEEFARLNGYHVSTGAVLPREAEEHAGRRRQPARSHAGDVRQPDGRSATATRTSGCRCSWPVTPTASSKATCTSRRRSARRWRTRS